MTNLYYALWRHHSISRSFRYDIRARSVRAAKAAAWRALGGGFAGHAVVLYRRGADPDGMSDIIVGCRTIGSRRGWQ